MVSGENSQESGFELKLFDAINQSDVKLVTKIIEDKPNLNLNCVDKDGLSPLQLACHKGDLQIATLLVDKGADVNFSKREDGYTPLMFAAIGGRKDLVKLLLEREVNTRVENCLKRTASDMAAFVGQSDVSAIINCWVPYKESIEPYTVPRELELEPRIPSKQLGCLIHEFIVHPSLHPIELLIFIMDHIDLVRYGKEFCYVLENLSSRALKTPINDETISLKYYYLSYLIEYCFKNYNSKVMNQCKPDDNFDEERCSKYVEAIIKRFIKQDDPIKPTIGTPRLNQFIIECLMKYPYTQTAVFKTMSFALSKQLPGHSSGLAVLTQSVDLCGPRQFGRSLDNCSVCDKKGDNKKCSQCKATYYCSPQCQKLDWFQHRKACQSLKDNHPTDED